MRWVSPGAVGVSEVLVAGPESGLESLPAATDSVIAERLHWTPADAIVLVHQDVPTVPAAVAPVATAIATAVAPVATIAPAVAT